MEHSTSNCTNIFGILMQGERRVLVITKNYQTFRSWCYEHSISPRNGTRVRYLIDPMQLMGYKSEDAIVVKANLWQECLNPNVIEAAETRLEVIDHTTEDKDHVRHHGN